ncbi:MAG: hypothetical protein R3B82_04085 [Sandaracinaceae bacterium]
MALASSPSVVFFISTKFPILLRGPITEPGRRCENGPTSALGPTVLSEATE